MCDCNLIQFKYNPNYLTLVTIQFKTKYNTKYTKQIKEIFTIKILTKQQIKYIIITIYFLYNLSISIILLFILSINA